LFDWYQNPLPQRYSAEELGIDPDDMQDEVVPANQMDVTEEILATWARREPKAVLPFLAKAMENPEHRELCCWVYAYLGHPAMLPYVEPWIERVGELTDEQACLLVEGLILTHDDRGKQFIARMGELVSPERTAIIETIENLTSLG
jgi:hypothetical protein